MKSPKIYLQDRGLLHSLLGIENRHQLLGHPRLGAPWEGFALGQTLARIRPSDCYFWGTHGGAELDLFYRAEGKRYGVEFKFQEAPRTTRSMHSALESLGLDHLWVVYPASEVIRADERITMVPLTHLEELIQPAP